MAPELEALKAEFESLRADFTARLTLLERRLQQQVAEREPRAAAPPETTARLALLGAARHHEQPATSAADPEEGETAAHGDPAPLRPTPAYEARGEDGEEEDEHASRPRLLSNLAQLAFSLGPLGSGLEALAGAYRHYRAQGNLTVFLLTAFGVVTTAVGFGYILQYSFASYLGDGAKMAVSAAAAVGIVVAGARIWRREAFRSYGSALIGLGLVLGYLVVYFSTEVYRVVGVPVGFSGLVLTTVAAFVLARLFETRIVASIMLYGGAFAPFLLDTSIALNPVYLGSLLTLCAASLRLAREIGWPRLGVMAFVLSAGVVELGVFTDTGAGPLELALLHGFHYLFAGWVLLDGRRIISDLSNGLLLLLAANLAVLTSTLWVQVGHAGLLAWLLLLNAAPYAVLGVTQRQVSKKVAAAGLGIAGGFAGVAIPVYFGFETMGIFYAQEAVVLVYLGSVWRLTGVRREGYLLAAVGTALCLGAITSGLFLSASFFRAGLASVLSAAYANLWTLGAMFAATEWILSRWEAELPRLEQRLLTGVRETVSLWGAFTFVVTAVLLLPSWGWHLAALPMAVLFWRGSQKDLKLTLGLGFGLVAVLAIPALVSMIDVGSVRFSLQSPPGKVALVEIFALLWLWQLYFERIAPTSPLLPAMRGARLLFYLLLPVIWLPTALRRFPDGLALVPWASVAIAWLLAARVRLPPLRIELWVLALLAGTTALVAAADDGTLLGYGSAGVCLGCLLVGAWLVMAKGWTRHGARHPDLGPIFAGSVFYVVAVVGVVAMALGLRSAAALCAVGVFLLFLPRAYRGYAPMRNMLRPMTRGGQAVVLVASCVAWVDGDYLKDAATALVCAVAFAFATYHKRPADQIILATDPRRRRRRWLLELHIAHVLIAGAYACWVSVVFRDPLAVATTVAMVLHAVVLFAHTLEPRFQGLQRLALGFFGVAVAKLMLLDIGTASLIEKVLAFCTLGGVSLAAAYRFQKAKAARMSRDHHKTPASSSCRSPSL